MYYLLSVILNIMLAINLAERGITVDDPKFYIIVFLFAGLTTFIAAFFTSLEKED